jgi:hypothetical protein
VPLCQHTAADDIEQIQTITESLCGPGATCGPLIGKASRLDVTTSIHAGAVPLPREPRISTTIGFRVFQPLPFLCRHPSFSVSGSASALDGVSLQEGQKISYEEQRDAKRGKSSAENLKAL